jgi:hypothetical protein
VQASIHPNRKPNLQPSPLDPNYLTCSHQSRSAPRPLERRKLNFNVHASPNLNGRGRIKEHSLCADITRGTSFFLCDPLLIFPHD